MKPNAFYAQSGGVTSVINASACGVIETARKHKDRIGKVYAGRGSKSQRVRAAIELKVAPFGIADIEREVPDVSRETVRNVLREMKKDGRVKTTGRGRGSKWELIG